MGTIKKIWSFLSTHPRTHALMRFLFSCTSYADLNPAAVVKRLAAVVTGLTIFFVLLSYPIGWAEDWSFREGYPMTMLSVFFLFAIGHFCLRIRDDLGPHNPSSALWKVLGYTFVFLAFDDWLRIHETADRLIHRIFGIHETEFTDHLDDLIVGLYGLVVAVILWRGRRALLDFIPAARYFIPAAAFSVLHFVLDLIISARSWIRQFVPDEVMLEHTIVLSEVVEECCKLYAEVFLLATVIYCFVRVRKQSEIKEPDALRA